MPITLKNRIELAEMLAGGGKRLGAEIGVATGRYSKILLDLNFELKLACIDDWANSKFAPTFKIAQEALSSYWDRCALVKQTSVDASKGYPDQHFDFVYIDANHEYNHVKDDLKSWVPKVKIGGIVAGDDYYLTKAGNLGVIRAVNEFCEANGYELHTTLWDLNQEVEDDRQPNWYFIKDH